MDLYAKNDKSLKSTKEISNYEIKQIGKTKLLFNFEIDCTFTHGDKMTNLIKARFFDDYEKNTCIAPDTAKYICFEIPTDTTVEEIAKKNVFDVLNQMGKFEDLMQKNYNNLGFIDRISNEKFQLYRPTSEVLSYTRDVLDKKIIKNEDILPYALENGNLPYMDEKKQKFREKISKPAMDYINNNNKKRAKIENEIRAKIENEIYIEEQYRYNIKEKVYTDYKTIDIRDGKGININRLEEIMKSNSENYLYSAYIDKIEREDDIEKKPLEKIPDGYPVLFTTQEEFDRIANSKNKVQISKFVELISDFSKKRGKVYQYIGGLDKEGRIYRTTENCSEEIKKKIEEIENLYKEEQERV